MSVGHAGISSANMATMSMSRDENIIDIEFNVFSDTPTGKDPDSFSPTLRRYQQFVGTFVGTFRNAKRDTNTRYVLEPNSR